MCQTLTFIKRIYFPKLSYIINYNKEKKGNYCVLRFADLRLIFKTCVECCVVVFFCFVLGNDLYTSRKTSQIEETCLNL